jgi:hypothetical protein
LFFVAWPILDDSQVASVFIGQHILPLVVVVRLRQDERVVFRKERRPVIPDITHSERVFFAREIKTVVL